MISKKEKKKKNEKFKGEEPLTAINKLVEIQCNSPLLTGVE